MTENPFTALTLIAAPAVLTNASSVLALGTSNRFARAVDRARTLSSLLEDADLEATSTKWQSLRLRQLGRVEQRCLLLVHALSFFYMALGAFSASALTSLLGAVVTAAGRSSLDVISGIVALCCGSIGVVGLVSGCTLLLRETRLAVLNLTEEATAVRQKFSEDRDKRDALTAPAPEEDDDELS